MPVASVCRLVATALTLMAVCGCSALSPSTTPPPNFYSLNSLARVGVGGVAPPTAAPTLIDKFFYKWGSDANKFETIFSTLSDQYMVVNCGNLGTDYQKITPRLFWVNLTGNPARLRGFASGSNFTLRYTGGNGLFNLYWKDWANWIMNDRKCVKIEKQMDFTQLKTLDFTKRYSIDGINYLISEVAVTLNISSIKSTQLKCFTAT